MNLYLLTQDVNTGYDTFDSVIVAARDEASARMILPSDSLSWEEPSYSWVSSPESVNVVFIGKAVKGTVEGVVLASFIAG